MVEVNFAKGVIFTIVLELVLITTMDQKIGGITIDDEKAFATANATSLQIEKAKAQDLRWQLILIVT